MFSTTTARTAMTAAVFTAVTLLGASAAAARIDPGDAVQSQQFQPLKRAYVEPWERDTNGQPVAPTNVAPGQPSDPTAVPWQLLAAVGLAGAGTVGYTARRVRHRQPALSTAD
ncbi:MAG: hypothetical protein ACRDV1_10445 [Actinomycetes bacterium]